MRLEFRDILKRSVESKILISPCASFQEKKICFVCVAAVSLRNSGFVVFDCGLLV